MSPPNRGWYSKTKTQPSASFSKSSVNIAATPEDLSSLVQHTTSERNLDRQHRHGGPALRGSSRQHNMHVNAQELDEQDAKQMAKAAKLMRKMARAEQREKNARRKAAMQDIAQARAAGIDPQKDEVGWDDDNDEEGTQHSANTSLRKPVTNLSAKPADSGAPAPESSDTLARFIHAMFSSMNPFEEAAHVEKAGDTKAGTVGSQPTEAQNKPTSKDPKDQQAGEEVLRLLSSASTMNQASQSRGSVWNALDRLTPGQPMKTGRDDAEGSLMISAPLFITESSKLEVAHSEMREVENHDDADDGKPQSSKFASLVTRMGMKSMFGSKKKSKETSPARTGVAEVINGPGQPRMEYVRVWRPGPDGISLQCSWWGYRIYLPPPVLAVLNDPKLEPAERAALVTTALQWMIDHVPTAPLPPQVGLVMSLIRGIIPALGYIGGFIAWSWNTIIGFDQGDGVVLSATWLLPIALIPGAWDTEPPRPLVKEIELEPELVVEVKAAKPSLSHSAPVARTMPSALGHISRRPLPKTRTKPPKQRAHPPMSSSSLHQDVPLDNNENTGLGSVQNTRSPHEVQSRQITSEEMFQYLVDHGCVNLSSLMDPHQYSSGLIVGGAFGDIWKGRLRNGTEVAIKVWRFSSISHNGSKSMKRAMREIYHWSKAKHENIQELIGVIMFQGRLGMVSLWMDHGNLREYIYKYPQTDRHSLCVQIAAGVSYLHNRKIVHGDIKAANILVSRDGIAKLSDFDHSIMAENSLVFSETSRLGGGTTRWMAPELILDESSRRNAHTDIYALGMTMLEIITGIPPYYPECREDIHVLKAVMQGRLPERQFRYFGNNTRDNQMWELLLRCWSYEPTARPKATEVLESLNVLW